MDKQHYRFRGVCLSLVIIIPGYLISQINQNTDYETRDVYIEANGIKQHGMLFTPKKTSGRLTSVVIGHGSAPNTYEHVGFYTALAQRMNMIILAYDKRGVGESEGQYEQFTVAGSTRWFDVLAKDMAAWFNWLSIQSGVDSTRIGMLGGSQAGWIMPLAASMLDDRVKFIISGEGTPLSTGEENYFSALTGDGNGGSHTIEEADKKMDGFSGLRGFDPKSILKKQTIPMLWIFGTQDPVIPVDASIRMLKALDNPNFKIEVLENGDHNFLNVVSKKRYNLVEYIAPWLKNIGQLD